MVWIFTLLVHVTLLLAGVGMVVLIISIISSTHTSAERFMRALSAASGFIIYVGAKAVGISLPDLMFRGLSISFPVAVGILGICIPAAAGYFTAWYVIWHLNSKDTQKNAVAMRLLTIVVTFIFFLYSDSYLATYGEQADQKIVLLLPNLTFVLTILLYAIFRFHPTEEFGLVFKLPPGWGQHLRETTKHFDDQLRERTKDWDQRIKESRESWEKKTGESAWSKTKQPPET